MVQGEGQSDMRFLDRGGGEGAGRSDGSVLLDGGGSVQPALCQQLEVQGVDVLGGHVS